MFLPYLIVPPLLPAQPPPSTPPPPSHRFPEDSRPLLASQQGLPAPLHLSGLSITTLPGFLPFTLLHHGLRASAPTSPPITRSPSPPPKTKAKSQEQAQDHPRRPSLIEKFKKKPYTAVTVQVDRLTADDYEEDDFSGIPDLIEVIRLQDSGPREASRAIRKKL